VEQAEAHNNQVASSTIFIIVNKWDFRFNL